MLIEDSLAAVWTASVVTAVMAVTAALAVTAAFTVPTVLTFFGTDNTVHRTYQSVLGTVCGGCTDSL